MSTLRSLHLARQKLVRVMQQLGYGLIEGQHIRDGNPVQEPPPRMTREVKFGGDNGPRAEASLADFTLKPQVVELLMEFDRLGTGVIQAIEVKAGLPFRMLVHG